jgi:hypothetical protein
MHTHLTHAEPMGPEPVRHSQSIGTDPARLQRIRERVVSGAYDTPKVVDAVARRLLEAQDL